jgi:hypothetical protein
VDESATVYVYIPQRGLGRRCDVNRVISLSSPRSLDQVTYLLSPPKLPELCSPIRHNCCISVSGRCADTASAVRFKALSVMNIREFDSIWLVNDQDQASNGVRCPV